MKVQQIVVWRRERITDASALFKSPFESHGFKKILYNSESAFDRQELLNWFASLKGYLQYESIFLLDVDGRVRMSVGATEEVVDSASKIRALEALSTRETVLSDLYRCELTGVIVLDLLIPIFIAEGGETHPVGVILSRIDPYLELYPLTQTWPTSSRTSENLLVRHDGEGGMFLNELRHTKNTALNVGFSLNESQLPSTMALSGKEGVVEGIDYRGIPVLAVLRKIPNSPWFLISKVDKEEIYAPERQQALFIATLVILLILGTGLSVGLLWRGQHLREGKQIEAILTQANTDLEQRVQVRTSELLAINESLLREIQERKQVEKALMESQSQLKDLSSQLLLAHENERRRFARELHDGLGQILTAVKHKLESFLKRMDLSTPAKNAEALQGTISLIQECIGEARRIQKDLRPSILDDLGIVATLGWFCREYQATYSNIEIDLKIDVQENEVPESLKIVLFRVSQEALNNVAKHSKANLVHFSLRKNEGKIELSIEDNGRGFGPEVFSVEGIQRGLGLASMKERTELSGGVFAVHSASQKGTLIRSLWPL